MRLPLPRRALALDAAWRPAGLRAALHRLWAQLWTKQLRTELTAEAHLHRAHDRAALRAEYAGHVELYPAPRGRRFPLASRPVQSGEDRP